MYRLAARRGWVHADEAIEICANDACDIERPISGGTVGQPTEVGARVA
jgi:hypothetical protein